jgi:hypothetical protein
MKERGKAKQRRRLSKGGWSVKAEKEVWTGWGKAVCDLVFNGVEADGCGWGLGAQGIDMRREIMKFLCRDDFVRGKKESGGGVGRGMSAVWRGLDWYGEEEKEDGEEDEEEGEEEDDEEKVKKSSFR